MEETSHGLSTSLFHSKSEKSTRLINVASAISCMSGGASLERSSCLAKHGGYNIFQEFVVDNSLGLLVLSMNE